MHMVKSKPTPHAHKSNRTDVLYIEDSPSDATLVAAELEGNSRFDFCVTVAERLADELALMSSRRFDVILVDLGLPDSNGLETFERVREAAPQVPVVVLAGADDEAVAAELLRHGAPDYLAKRHLGGGLLVRAVRNAIERNDEHTEHLKLEAQFRQAVKMEAVGRLAGGIAHDFNNLLTAILGYSEIAIENPDLPPQARQDIEEVRRAAESAARLTSQLLAFSRRQILQPKILDLSQDISRMGSMLHRLIGEDIQLATSLMPDVGLVRADPGQVDQIIMNLVVNARDAMPDGGHLTIETANVELDDAFVADHHGASTGPHVMIAVSDTGGGMSEDVQQRVFEPFFTTKSQGKGTGLGLATVYGIVKQSEGSIWVYSEVGRGTTFKVYLPRVIAEHPLEVSADRAVEQRSGSETILMVEDQESVRTVTKTVLERCGYAVLEAENGPQALKLSGEHSGSIDLLLTDVVMPHMSGRELAQTLAEKCPHLRVLYTSGYTDDAVLRHGVLAPGVAFLQKPFTASGLALKVRQVLDASEAPTI